MLDATRTGTPQFNIMIPGEHPADWITVKGRPIQTKTMQIMRANLIAEALQNKGALPAIKQNKYRLFY